jgi:hypothetical protein
MAASLECTARWVRLLLGTLPEDATPPSVGPIAAAISGSLGAGRTMPTALPANSTTSGSSILPSTNGHGSAEAARLVPMMASPESTARWVHPLRETLPAASMPLPVGPMPAGISGSLGDRASMPTTIMSNSTAFGSSILPQANGHGWAEAAPSAAMVSSPVCTAHWVRRLPVTFPETAAKLQTGPPAATISGSLEEMATMPAEMAAI